MSSHVFIRKRTVVTGISTNFKWWNSGEGEDVTIRWGFSVRGRGSVFQGSVRTLEDAMETLLFNVQGIYESVPKSIKPVKLPVFD